MDFISSSPSLVDILKYVEHEDILNFKLVNRRFYQTIQNNSVNMPREKASLNLVMYEEDSGGSFYSISTSDTKRDHAIYILDGLTVFLEYSRSTLQYFKEYDALHSTPFTTEEKDKVKNILEGAGLDAQQIERCIIYSNSGRLEGLRTPLSMLARRHYFDTFEIENDEEIEGWDTVVAEAFRSSPSRCNKIQAYKPKGLANISLALACDVINLCNNYCDDNCIDEIAEVATWDRNIQMKANIRELEDMSSMLQEWESGKLSLKKVELISSRDQYTSLPSNTWYYESLDPLLSSLKDVESEDFPNNGDVTCKKIHRIGRNSDGKILLLTSYFKATRPYTRHLSVKET